MAALRGTIRGDRVRSNSTARSTRLADRSINVHADTWNTFSEIELEKDGSGWVSVRQNGRTILHASWSAESESVSSVAVTMHGRTGETVSSTADETDTQNGR